MGRMTKVETSTNGSTWTKDAEYTGFLADGQPTQLKLGNSNIQTVDYLYTVQGWLEKINNPSSIGSDEFAMELDYTLNGNISQQQWRQPELNGNLATYSYSYDNANRLTAANFSGSGTGYTSNSFDLKFMNYDKNGNITGYDRRNKSGGTDLEGFGYYGMSFESNSNRIDKVTEQGNYIDFDMDYDASGNMTKNELNGLSSVDYDWRNLPAQTIGNSTTLQYAYDAEGNRVKKKVVSGVETHYVRGAGGETMAIYQADTLVYHNILAGADIIGNHKNGYRKYFLKDHLGSVRTTVDDAGVVKGYDDYYPFGLTMPGRSSNSANPNDAYKYTGYEQDDEAGINLYHANARFYDPVIPRFGQIDPHHFNYPGVSPYAYVGNNPINIIDPTGMDWYCTSDDDGNCTSYGYDDELTKDNAGDRLEDGQQYLGNDYTVENSEGNDIYLMDGGDWDYIVGQVPEMPEITGLGSTGAGYAWAYALNRGGNAQARAAGRDAVLLRDYLEYERQKREAAGDMVMTAFGARGYAALLRQTGGMKQWLRLGKSYSETSSVATVGLRWGASPRYVRQIKNLTLRKWNRDLRKLKIPGNNWRVNDAGHLHFWKK